MTKQAKADRDLIKTKPALRKKVDNLLKLITDNPFAIPPSYEKLVGDFRGAYSRKINDKHRLIYKVDKEKLEIIIIRMWTHYEE